MAIDGGTIERAWRDALAVWDAQVSLSPPEPWEGGEEPGRKKAGEADEPLAYIDLTTRHVVVNFDLLSRLGAEKSLPAVLAHEIGHHVAFPHTLGLSAALEVLQERLIPGHGESLTNLFFDLQVNEVVGRTRAEELAAVYRGFVARGGGALSPLFAAYLAVYEELWGLPPGSLVPPPVERELEERFPGFRAEARVFAQTFYALAETHLQFVYFCSHVLRYLPEPGTQTGGAPRWSDVPEPSADDYARALGGSPAADKAIEEAKRRGWLPEGEGSEADPLATIDALARRGGPGSAVAAFREALVADHYRRLVDRHLVEIPLPKETPPPEPFLPTTLEEWAPGDPIRAIDWTASILTSGTLAPALPLKRELEPELPSPVERGYPVVEIYLDTSGSMPHPASALNAMTLAAQILSAAALRKKGMVRAVIYSAGPVLESPWMRDEETARRFLLNHAGGGTDFPFETLRKSADERQDVLRVIISDSDFLSNVQHGTRFGRRPPAGKGKRKRRGKAEEGVEPGPVSSNADVLAAAASRSRLLLAVLATYHADPALPPELQPLSREPRFRYVPVASPGALAETAAKLARALLGD